MWLWELFTKYFGVMAFAGLGGLIATLIIEKTKSSWSKKDKEHEVKFTKYHEKQADVMAELYVKMSKMEGSVKHHLFESIPIEENESLQSDTTANKDISDFWSYFMENEIFLSDEICLKVDAIHKMMRGAHWAPFSHTLKGTHNDNSEEVPLIDVVKDEIQKLTEEFPKLRRELKLEIKKILSGKMS